jgi:hypothetical protein
VGGVVLVVVGGVVLVAESALPPPPPLHPVSAPKLSINVQTKSAERLPRIPTAILRPHAVSEETGVAVEHEQRTQRQPYRRASADRILRTQENDRTGRLIESSPGGQEDGNEQNAQVVVGYSVRQPRYLRFTARPEALRPRLSAGLPLSLSKGRA